MQRQGAIGIAAAWLLLTSCTTASLEELRHTVPQGTPFQMALAREYLALSDWEAEQYDWVDSRYFAEKGLRVAYGQEVPPEEVTAWNIPEEMVPEFSVARDKLLKVLTEQVKSEKPELAARAYYAYDCWLEQQEEGWQELDIRFCRDMFYAAIEELEMAEEPTPLIRSTAYMVFFDHDKAALTQEAKQILTHVLQDLAQHPDTEILLHGHTDRSGSEEYNMALSEKRALAVKELLAANGIAEDRIAYFAFGETDLRVNTEDGIREPANRRVEIFLE